MDHEHALDRLAPVYARALRLAACGWTEQQIGAELGIDPAAVEATLAIGAEKLARVLAEDEPG